jgi:hypothetical protein
MPSVNRVFVIGVVAAPPVKREGGCRLVIGIPEERSGAELLERVDVEVWGHLVATACELRPAQLVYAEGRLTRTPAGSALVTATGLVALGDAPPPPPVAGTVTGTHASPHPHERAGHPRRINIGTPRERVIWVRPTTVGERKPPPS